MRPVLWPGLGEPEPPGQVVLAAGVYGGPGGMEPGDGRYYSGLHDLRVMQPALFGFTAYRGIVDEAGRKADKRGEEDDHPAVRDDGGGDTQRGRYLGWLSERTSRVVS